ncbi:MAG TPA: phosphoenolpyruvate-utilizing N-terminal domain-containing protein [Symbiobacteriaceae bacterium]|nr:phosphoenolpyruvate-utilizing N-terminal domain-containing protein [Symbiobacteriaceae bacterium]
MQSVEGTGCRAGQAEGVVVWLKADSPAPPGSEGVADRAAEVLHFRAAVARALEQLETWTEQQPSLEGRVLLQGYREALQEDAWMRRACSLIDVQGIPAAVAAREAAEAVAAVLERREEQQRVEPLKAVAGWMAERLTGRSLPAGAIVAATDLSPLELLDIDCPVLIAGPEPVVVTAQPLVWGLAAIGPQWHGRRVAINGRQVTLDVPDPRWWLLAGGRLADLPICYLDGDIEAVGRMAARLGQAPVAMVYRVDDLAAVPLFLSRAAAVALDLDRVGPRRLKHPGVRLLIDAAIRACQEAQVPVLAGGVAAAGDPEAWLALGFTALFGRTIPQGGQHALRRHTPRGL